jgi:hypothetical protein
MKTGQKSVFEPHEGHIMSKLDVLVLYINFYRFQKILSFGSKHKGVSFCFYRKTFVRDENYLEICILTP